MSSIPNIVKARTQLSMTEPFFSTILFKHEMVPCEQVPLAGVTPTGKILYNPERCEQLPVQQLIFLLAHEVLHVAFDHSLRKENRDHWLWNVAGDAVINETLIALGVGQPIDGGVRYPNAENMTTEEMYDRLLKEGKGRKPGDEPGEGSGSGSYGENTDLPEEQRDVLTEDHPGEDDPLDKAHQEHSKRLTEEERRNRQVQNKLDLAEARTADKMQNKARGSSHAAFSRLIDALLEAEPLPWYEQLSRYMTKYVNQGITWRRPNKRFSNAYLPVQDREPAMGKVVIGVDTSGSISSKELACFEKHVKDLISACRPESTITLYCDSYVGEVVECDNPDEFELHPSGGGGTDMTEITRWCNEYDEDEIDACIIFTDGWTPYPSEGDERVDTVWVLTTEHNVPDHIKCLRFNIDEV